jgi:hypothetical protein
MDFARPAELPAGAPAPDAWRRPYAAPRVERALTQAELEQEILYAGIEVATVK